MHFNAAEKIHISGVCNILQCEIVYARGLASIKKLQANFQAGLGVQNTENYPFDNSQYQSW